MKILLLTDYYPPESNAPAIRCAYHAEHWAKQGHEVMVLTCAPNFPNGVIFRGYKNRLFSSCVINGVTVVRCWSFIAKNEGFTLRILDHISSAFMFAIIPFFLKRSDVIIATSPQFMTLISGYISSRLVRRPLVSEVRDMWPEGIIFLAKDSFTYKILEKIELFIYRKSSKVIAVTEAFANSIELRAKISRRNIYVSYNGCDDNVPIFRSSENFRLRQKLNIEKRMVVGYAGTIGISHGLDILVKSFQEIASTIGAVLIIIGSGAMHNQLKKLCTNENLSEILVLDAVSKDEISHFLNLFDICLVSLKDVEAYDKVIPSKLFEAAAHDKPVIAGLRGEARSIVQNYGFGEVFKPENSESFKEKLNVLVNNLRDEPTFYSGGLKKVREEFSRDIQSNIVLDCLKGIN